jgi:hypothetical protein
LGKTTCKNCQVVARNLTAGQSLCLKLILESADINESSIVEELVSRVCGEETHSE